MDRLADRASKRAGWYPRGTGRSEATRPHASTLDRAWGALAVLAAVVGGPLGAGILLGRVLAGELLGVLRAPRRAPRAGQTPAGAGEPRAARFRAPEGPTREAPGGAGPKDERGAARAGAGKVSRGTSPRK